MGGIISLITGRDTRDIIIDFENARPTGEAELEVYNFVEPVLKQIPEVLQLFREYQGCGELIRTAINTPSDETEGEALKVVIPNVLKQKRFFELSQQIGRVPSASLTFTDGCVSRLISALVLGNPGAIGDQQALLTQLAHIFDFVLTFDELKMGCPQLQNDFSFYRRNLVKMKRNGTELPINDEKMTNQMSLFFAFPSPQMKCVVDAAVAVTKSGTGVSVASVTSTFGEMANIFLAMSQNPNVDGDVSMFCLRAMTSAFIIYDHISPLGAFNKKSEIRTKDCILALKNTTPVPDTLLNAIRYTTVHLSDADTPTAITNLLS